MLLSIIKDTVSDMYLSRVLIGGSYLILLVVVGIGFLFTRLALFVNPMQLNRYVCESLVSESKMNLSVICERNLSIKIIQEKITLKQYMSPFKRMTNGNMKWKENHRYILDIKIKSLKKIVDSLDEDCKNKISMNEIYLDKELFPKVDDGLFYVAENDFDLLEGTLQDMNKCIITSPNAIVLKSDTKEYVLQKIMKNISENNDKSVEIYLDILEKMYDLQQTIKSWVYE